VAEVSFSFDQNMRLAYALQLTSGDVLFRWYDSVSQGYIVTTLSGCRSPRVNLDDKRPEALQYSDVILSYIRGSIAYCRFQRDRYGVEYAMRSGIPETADIRRVGLNRGLRWQAEIVDKGWSDPL